MTGQFLEGISQDLSPRAYAAQQRLNDAVSAMNTPGPDALQNIGNAIVQLVEAVKATNNALALVEAQANGYDAVDLG